jgi:hypothetical protein
MTDTYNYLTEDIYSKNKVLYYKEKPIRKNNWHTILSEIGWSKLHVNWIKLFNSYHPNPYKNSQFGLLDVPSDGDCLFHCLAKALSSTGENYYESEDIRQMLADSIHQEQFDTIISLYRCLKDSNDFDEEWDPYEIETLEAFKVKLIQGGHDYWCDHILLQLIVQQLKLNVFILEQNESENYYEKYSFMTTYREEYDSILLLYINGSHFQLLGHFKDTMHQLFTHKTLPLEIKKLYEIIS